MYRVLALALLAGALFSSEAHAQQRRITGRVTATGSGEALANTAVTVVGTTIGTYTAEDGSFQILAPSGDVTLLARRVGFKRATVAVPAGQDQASIALERDVLQLEEQVVTGTATTVSSVNAANAVAVVSGEQLNRVPSQTVDNALQGKVAGATITQNSGAPGGGTQIQVRGPSTIYGSFTPLYVIDGVIVDNSQIANGLTVITQAARQQSPSSQDQRVNRAADLNPNDIESIQILKGPSASSIYGSRGTNGVVIITTKRGRAGKTTLDIDQRFGTSAISNTIDIKCFSSAQEVLDFGFDTTGWGASTDKCHNYQKELYGENPFNYQTVASIRGATQQGTNFFVSGLVEHDGGLVKNDFYNKQSLRANLGQQFGARLNIRANTELIHSLTQRGVSGNDNTGISPYTTFSQTPSFIDLRRRPDGSFPRNPNNSVGNNNPFQVAEQVKTPENVYRLLGSATGTFSILTREKQTLDFTMTGGVDAYADNAKVIAPATLYVEQVNALPGSLVNNQGNVVTANLQGALNHKFITSLFTATTSTGFRQDRNQYDIITNTGHGVFPGVTNVANSTQVVAFETQDLVKAMSLFAQEEFLTLGERLLLTAGVNSERTSNNGDPKKFYSYPKFSASYRLPWLPPVTDELKLRIAYGRAGNQPVAGKYTFLTNLVQEGMSGYRASTTVGAASIQPEVSGELEGGIDLTMLGGRGRLSVTQFRKQTDNLLLPAGIAPSTGFSTQWINGGQIVQHGTEIELGMTPVQTGRVEWISNTTYASNLGKFTRLPVAPFIPPSGSFGSRYGNAFVQQGQITTVLQAVDGCTALVTNPKTGVQSCPTANRILKFMGNSAPDFQMGFNNDVNFGPFRFGSLVDWRKGGLAVNLTNAYFDAGLLADTAIGNKRAREWTKGHAVYVENAGFVKIRELTFGYELPSGVTSRLFNGRVQTARIDLSGRNLYTWTRYTGLDPEVSNFGNQALGRFQDVTPYPPSRSFYLIVNTTF
ncbi:MAG TPA: SusC/RagA family TonB-linked outer membrane protein [Gemmatimonadaceae bacterium]